MRNALPVGLTILAVLLLAACASSPPALLSAVQQLQALHDPDFNGGLTDQEMALAQRLADEIGAQVPGEFEPCGEPDPDVRDKDYTALKDAKPVALARQVPVPFQVMASLMVHGSPEQKAVIAQSITRMGKRAGALESLAYVMYHADHSMWVGEALHVINCEHFDAYKVLAGTVPPDKLPVSDGEQCHGPRASWLLYRLGDTSRHWPKDFFSYAWSAATVQCGYDDIAGKVEIDEAAVLAMRPLFVGRSVESGRLSDALFILERLGASAKPVASDVMSYIASDDREMALNSAHIVVHAGIPDVVGVLKYRVEHGDWLPVDESDVARLATYTDELIPIFAEALVGPNFNDRVGAANDLGATHSSKVIPYLLAAISDDDWETSQEAVRSLAQFVPTSPEVRTKLSQVARNYWSGQVRWTAQEALEGKVSIDDPFDPCTSAVGAKKSDTKSLGCIHIGPYSLDHRQKHCRDGSLNSGRYKTTAGKVIHIEWTYWHDSPADQLPRGVFKDMSISCRHHPILQLLRVDNGYLAGCTGFEWMGGMIFIPDDTSKPVQKIYEGSVQVLVKTGGRVFMWGLGSSLEEMTQAQDGSWKFKDLAGLPGLPNGYAVVGDSLAFVDEFTTSLYEPGKGLSLLSCQD